MPYTSLHYRCLTGIQSRLQSLSLDSIASDHVVIRWLPKLKEQLGDAQADTTPLVVISPPGQEVMSGGTNAEDDIAYPCVVAFFDKTPDLANNLARNLLWRELAIKALRNQHLAGVDEIIKVEIVPDVVISLGAWTDGYWFSAFIARCLARQTRGT